MRKTFIAGVSGQDGSYLAELFIEKGYKIQAILRRASVLTTQRIDHEHFKTYLSSSSNLHRLLTKIHSDEVYNLGVQSFAYIIYLEMDKGFPHLVVIVGIWSCNVLTWKGFYHIGF